MIKKILSLLGLQNSKTNNVAKNILAAFIIKGAALVVSLLTMPIYMDFFGDETVLGIWFTVLSVMSWILNFDLGIGNGLRNKLSASFATGDTAASREYISSGYWITGWFVVILSLIGWFVIPVCNWNSILNIDAGVLSPQVMHTTLRIVFLGMMLQFFFRLITSVLYALQKASVNNFIALITSVSQMLFALVAPSGTASENLIMFAGAYVVCANLPLVVATVLIFRKSLRNCIPHFKAIRKNKVAEVTSLGGAFFLCQILYMIIANTNEFLITNFTSPDHVVEYQIYYKVFTLGSMVAMLALTPMWSAISKAVAEKDYPWLRQSYKRLKQIGAVSILCEFAVVPFTQILINLWLGQNAVQVNFVYAAIFASYAAILMYQSVLSTFACGLGILKLQAICYGVAVVLKIALSLVGVKLGGSWIVVVGASTLVLVPYCVLEQLRLNRLMKRLTLAGPA